MGALSKQDQAKKPGKKASLHTEPVHALPAAVDWDEQERIKQSLKGKYMPQFRADGAFVKSGYDPEVGAKLCIMRRQGMSLNQIVKKTGHVHATIKKWLFDYPEFAQEWNDGYTDYLTSLAEEMPSIAENLLNDLKRDGKKLSAKQSGRYFRALEFLSEQVKFHATRRVRELYGDAEGGNEMVLIQQINIPTRDVTQDVARAEAYKLEVQDGADVEDSVPDTSDPDGSGGDGAGGSGSPEHEPGDPGAPDEVPGPLGRDEGGSGDVPEHRE
jgi:hypothetical protein